MNNEEIYYEYRSGKIETLYVLGMAKSSLNLNGAKSDKLELDFLRILHAIKTRKSNEKVIGYLAVTSDRMNIISNRIESWKKKYSDTKDPILILKMNDEEKINILKQEKEKNKEGINLNSNRLSEAKKGKEILETFLKEQIESKLKGIQETKEDKLFGINWDYYAKLERKN